MNTDTRCILNVDILRYLCCLSFFSACNVDVENHTNKRIVTDSAKHNNPTELIVQEQKESKVVDKLIIYENKFQKINWKRLTSYLIR